MGLYVFMEFGVFLDGKKLIKQEYNSEEEFEKDVKNNSKQLFGEKTIYFDIKKKIDTASLGSSIPDGILFDFDDPEEIKFYLIEVELASHDFYKHIFPQITKFFAFYKNSNSRNNLIEKIFSLINDNPQIAQEFRELANSNEIYKKIKDAVVNKQKMEIIKIFEANPHKVVNKLKEKLKEKAERYSQKGGLRRLQVSLSHGDLKEVEAREINFS